MGWQIEKDVLYPGRVVVPGDKGLRAYTFTTHDLDQINRTNNAKIADGWNIPLVWEHQDESPDRRKMVKLSQAERQREFARGVFGVGSRFIVRNGRLRAILEGDDDDDLKQFAKVKFISPEVQWDWRDTDGKVWPGPTITHLAATPRPVQRHQDAVQLSQNRPAPSAFSSLREFLSEGQQAARVAGTIHPFAIRLSLTDYEAPMADMLNGEGKKTPWERIAASMASVGIQIGDGKNIKDADHLADLVDVACLNSDKGDPDTDELEPQEDDLEEGAGDLEQPPPNAAPPGQPLQMSLTKKLLARERQDLVSRAERIAKSGALKPADGDALVEEMQSVRLSLNATTGDLERNESIIRLEALERVRPGTGNWAVRKGKRVRLSHTRPIERSPYQSKDDPKDDDEFVAQYESLVGRGK